MLYGLRPVGKKTIKKWKQRASKIIGKGRHLEQECKNRIIQKTKEILANKDHTLYHCYEFMRSGKRLRSLKCRTSRYLNTYVPYSIRLYNGQENC